MKIAVTYENGQIFQHFGHTSRFKVDEIQDSQITSSQVVDTAGSGHGALAGFLMEHGIDTLICGGIGGGAQNALAQAGIKLYGGVAGDADAAVQALLENNLHLTLTYSAATMTISMARRAIPVAVTAAAAIIAVTKQKNKRSHVRLYYYPYQWTLYERR